ncbi:LSU ribosomal protein L10P [Magnetococcus marinus MC-1]|uniref:Large ribosomal subunit protein uL10 n=1 Tax=Magnetococcus marinus (strain ATCC BAA-1437 / JCM 17883 / MC-1) TaxID=156889 RepID=A0L5W4_MAGMM|nr:50S ribosomal protein L10 [Magnetococcus marinus]ABK43357.1 LSU ribosomal protein L10P [Magnetococcus marinus MC-1]
MKQADKSKIVEEVRELLSSSSVAVVTHYRGLTVAEMTELRVKLREAGANVRVVKNTLAKRAVAGTPFEALGEFLVGPTSIAFSADPVAPAKVISAFAKTHPKIQIVGGVLDGKAMDAEGIERLAKLPSKEELLAKMLGSLNAPITNFVGVLAAVPGSFVRVLNAVREQKEAA